MAKAIAVIFPAVWAVGLVFFYSLCRTPHPPAPGAGATADPVRSIPSSTQNQFATRHG
jgi:hypothetical protein